MVDPRDEKIVPVYIYLISHRQEIADRAMILLCSGQHTVHSARHLAVYGILETSDQMSRLAQEVGKEAIDGLIRTVF